MVVVVVLVLVALVVLDEDVVVVATVVSAATATRVSWGRFASSAHEANPATPNRTPPATTTAALARVDMPAQARRDAERPLVRGSD
jgi:hypothetical protein